MAQQQRVAVGSRARRGGGRVADRDDGQVGERDVAAVLTAARHAGLVRPIHLAGRDHIATGAAMAIVYASEVLPADGFAAAATGRVVLLHSARAARRVAALIAPDARRTVSIAAISAAVAAAAGDGWRRVAAISTPDDAALVALALAIDPAAGGGDKTA